MKTLERYSPRESPGWQRESECLPAEVQRLTDTHSARHKFCPDDYWVMSSQMDLQGFVEAAV
jgi:hypothetical protein